jgi:hypothetical protein
MRHSLSLSAAIVGLASLFCGTASAQLGPIRVPSSPINVSPPKQFLPGLSQLDPNKKGSVTNQNLNNGLDYLKDRRHTMPPEDYSELKTTPGSTPPKGQTLGQTSTVRPDEYVGRSGTNGMEMWRSGQTGRIYYKGAPLGQSSQGKVVVPNNTNRPQASSSTPRPSLPPAVYIDPRTGRVVSR